jgi:hypothetical protein
MNNEPVAWLMVNRDDGNRFIQMGKPTRDDKVGHEPHSLYTHPAEHDLGIAEAIGFEKGYKAATAKTLTDEEIVEFIKSWEGLVVTNRTIEMFRAILKKASEK